MLPVTTARSAAPESNAFSVCSADAPSDRRTRVAGCRRLISVTGPASSPAAEPGVAITCSSRGSSRRNWRKASSSESTERSTSEIRSNNS